MTRQEEREKAAHEYIQSDVVSPENMQLAFGDFINGAEWADRTMLDKVCEWLKCNLPYSSKPPYQVIEDLRKAMED